MANKFYGKNKNINHFDVVESKNMTPRKGMETPPPQSRNKGMERCVTAPVLQTVNDLAKPQEPDPKPNQKGFQKKPPKIPCKQRSTC